MAIFLPGCGFSRTSKKHWHLVFVMQKGKLSLRGRAVQTLSTRCFTDVARSTPYLLDTRSTAFGVWILFQRGVTRFFLFIWPLPFSPPGPPLVMSVHSTSLSIGNSSTDSQMPSPIPWISCHLLSTMCISVLPFLSL